MKTGLKISVKLYKYIAVILFLLTIDIFPQINLNGFCKYSSSKVDAGYLSLFPLNYNKDPFTDLLIYNPLKKDVLLAEGDYTGNVAGIKKLRLRHPISAIRNLSFGEIYSNAYVYLSRKSRTAGLVNFKPDGELYLLDQYTFDSYPEKIDVADADLNLSPDILVCGPAFNGISVLHTRNGKLSERKIIKGVSFKEAVFNDLNNDGYSDIAGVNLTEMTIDFLYNNSKDFKKVRSLELQNLPLSFNSIDVDLDYYEDLVWSEKQKIIIRFGDMSSSFDDQLLLNTLYDPDIIISGDYNKDGNIDLIYADTSAGIISALFSSGDRNFKEEHMLFRKKNISALIPYYSKFIGGIAALDSSGTIYYINEFTSLGEEVSITGGLKPGVMSWFDYKNDGMTDISFIDEEEVTLNLLVRNSAGIPSDLFKYKLYLPHREIETESISKVKKIFYCWTRGEKLIEIITADFENNIFSRNSLYASGKINNLKVQHIEGGPGRIYAAYIKDGSAGANVFEFHDFRYIKADYRNFAFNVSEISPFLTKKQQGFYTWQQGDKLKLYSHTMKDIAAPKMVGQMAGAADRIVSFTGDIFNTGTPVHFAFLKRGDSGYLVTAMDKLNFIPGCDSFDIQSSDQLYMAELKSGGLNNVFLYIPAKRSLNRITLFNKGKNVILSELFPGISVNRYFVKNMSLSDYYLIYSNSEENCITIKRF